MIIVFFSVATISDQRPSIPKKQQQESFVNWSKSDVQTWLVDNGLGHQSAKFERFDGKLLKQLQTMYRNSPGTPFYQSAREFLDINDLPDLLHLANMLDELK
jgi:hypothetical protein